MTFITPIMNIEYGSTVHIGLLCLIIDTVHSIYGLIQHNDPDSTPDGSLSFSFPLDGLGESNNINLVNSAGCV